MSSRPDHPKLYHITHVDNLPAVIREGHLICDAAMLARGGPVQSIGISDIKRRRIERRAVSCHPGTKVGDYVPFYFCPRSIMLYVLHCANHSELAYRGGQGPIVHLEADLHAVMRWAEGAGRRWAFSLSNAGASYSEFRARVDDLGDLNWAAITATDFRAPEIKEGKQAEFLVHGTFPFDLVERIGVHSDTIGRRVLSAVGGSRFRPVVEVRSDWYY